MPLLSNHKYHPQRAIDMPLLSNHKYHPQRATWYKLHNTSLWDMDLNIMGSFSKASKIPPFLRQFTEIGACSG